MLSKQAGNESHEKKKMKARRKQKQRFLGLFAFLCNTAIVVCSVVVYSSLVIEPNAGVRAPTTSSSQSLP